MNGVLKGSEEEHLKLDTNDNLFKLLGDKKTFKYWIQTESLFDTTFDKSNSTANYQGVNSYSLNLNFHYKSAGSYTFNGTEVFTLTTASGHQIFPGNSTTMNLYLVVGPNYDNDNTCTAGFVFSTTPTPYKIFNQQTGQSSYTNFDTACANTGDPCNCRPTANSTAYIDYDVAQKISLSETQVAMMDKVENITLAGSGVAGDSFSIKKPLVVNEFNVAQHVPSFGMSAENLCKNITPTTPLNLSVQSGLLNYINLNHGFSNANNSAWGNLSDSESYSNLNLMSTTYIPNFSAILNTDILRHTYLYLSAYDEFDRQFVRRVNCTGN